MVDASISPISNEEKGYQLQLFHICTMNITLILEYVLNLCKYIDSVRFPFPESG